MQEYFLIFPLGFILNLHVLVEIIAYHCYSFSYSGGEILRDVKDGSGKIWMDQVECTESDTDIRECAFSGWGKTNCDHAEDVGIMCETKWSNTPGRGKNDKKGSEHDRKFHNHIIQTNPIYCE